MKRYVLILTKPPYGCEEHEKALELLHSVADKGNQAVVYLLGDAVEIAKKYQTGTAGEKLSALAEKGVSILSSENDMIARGLTGDQVFYFVKPIREIFDSLVEVVMGNADRVISC